MGISVALGLDRQTVRKAMEGVPPAKMGASGPVYSLKAAVEALGLGRKKANTGDKNHLDIATIRLKEAQAEKQELNVAKARGEVVYTEAAFKVFIGVLMDIKSKVMAIPTKAAPRVVGMKREAPIQAKLKEVTNEALNVISKLNPDDFMRELRRASAGVGADVGDDGPPTGPDGEQLGGPE